jgi:hypothetical protein
MRIGRSCPQHTADQLRGPRQPLANADLVSCIRLFCGAARQWAPLQTSPFTCASRCRKYRANPTAVSATPRCLPTPRRHVRTSPDNRSRIPDSEWRMSATGPLGLGIGEERWRSVGTSEGATAGDGGAGRVERIRESPRRARIRRPVPQRGIGGGLPFAATEARLRLTRLSPPLVAVGRLGQSARRGFPYRQQVTSAEHCVQLRSSIACAGFISCNALLGSRLATIKAARAAVAQDHHPFFPLPSTNPSEEVGEPRRRIYRAILPW